jgi:hypothetical protein
MTEEQRCLEQMTEHFAKLAIELADRLRATGKQIDGAEALDILAKSLRATLSFQPGTIIH